eukprot:RCo051449
MADDAKNHAIDFAKTRLSDYGGAGILPFLRGADGNLFEDFPHMTNDTDRKDFIRGVLAKVHFPPSGNPSVAEASRIREIATAVTLCGLVITTAVTACVLAITVAVKKL